MADILNLTITRKMLFSDHLIVLFVHTKQSLRQLTAIAASIGMLVYHATYRSLVTLVYMGHPQEVSRQEVIVPQ